VSLRTVEDAVLAAVDVDAVRADLETLVSFPSVGGSAAETDVVDWCAGRLGALGCRVERWEIDLDELRADPGFPGMEVDRTAAVGCVGTYGRGDRPALIFNGHCDVVPPGDPAGWSGRDPYALHERDGRLWGRGACDMKAGVAAVLGALAAVRTSGVVLRRPLAVHPVIGEEDGGIGAFATLRRGHTGDRCVIAEPTDRAIVPANAGSLTFRLTVPGRATHGSTRTRGVSAIEKFEVVHRALRGLEADRNRDRGALFAHLDLGWPLSVGIVAAGDWASTVPDRLVAEGRYGVRPDETVAEARRTFERAVAEACSSDPWLREHPVAVSWPGGVFAPGALPPGHRLLDEVRAAVADATGSDPRTLGGPYGSDLRHYTGAGIPTVQYGPGEVRFAHATDEQVDFADVLDCVRTYVLLALRTCG
jgi:acetylornithine deacetylase